MSKNIQIAGNPAMQFLSCGQESSPKVQAEPVLTHLTEVKTNTKQDLGEEVIPETSRTESKEPGMPIGNLNTPLKIAVTEIERKIQKSNYPAKKELKKRRVNLIIRQSLSDSLEMVAHIKEISFNEAFTRAVQAYVEAERTNLEAYKRFKAKIKGGDENGAGC
jgi:hypothetical protein